MNHVSHSEHKAYGFELWEVAPAYWLFSEVRFSDKGGQLWDRAITAPLEAGKKGADQADPFVKLEAEGCRSYVTSRRRRDLKDAWSKGASR